MMIKIGLKDCWNFPIKNISICKILCKKIISSRFLFKSTPKKSLQRIKQLKLLIVILRL